MQQQSLLTQARSLAQAGVDFLQLREKDLDAADLLALARALRAELAFGQTRLLLNGPLRVALSAHAHGLHLPGGWSAAELAGARSGFLLAGLPAPVLSVSAHTLSDVRAAAHAGADLILFGPVFEKRVHGEQVLPGLGLAALATAAQAAGQIPVLALGGVDAGNTTACLAAGAAGAAGIRLFLPPASHVRT